MDPLVIIGVAIASLLMSILGGIAGIGTALGMVPILTLAFGVQVAVPIVAVAMVFNNLSRWWANREYTNYRVAVWFAVGAVPLAILGSVVFAGAAPDVITRALGVFLLVLVVYRHIPIGRDWRMTSTRKFAVVGGGQGFLDGLFGAAGPFGAHFFLAFGLRKNAFVATVAFATFSMNMAKAGTYARFALLDLRALGIAVGIGIIMVAGAYIGGTLVKRLPDQVFVYIVEAIMVCAGIALIIQTS
ncbi:MAG: sulfite exporter TauE/SafE family protein [Dehalococcoidia bacterium]